MDLNGFFQLQDILNEHVGLNWDYFIKTFSTCEGQKDQDALMEAQEELILYKKEELKPIISIKG